MGGTGPHFAGVVKGSGIRMRAGQEPSGAPGGSPVSSRALSQALKFAGAEVLSREVPVHQMVEESLDEVGAQVLIVQIAGVHPVVAGEACPIAVRTGGFGVAGSVPLQVIAVRPPHSTTDPD